MVKAIIFKEWLKTRNVFFAAFALSIAVTVYAVIVMNRLIQLQGVEHLWMIVLLKDNSFVDIIKYSPLVSALAISAAQMVPEMQQRRLKLTLHLPYSQYRMVVCMLCVGIVELLIIYIVQWLIILIYDMSIMPYELTSRILLTTIPWALAGLIAYLFVASICIEGTWRRRLVLALLAVACVMICFLQTALEAYNGILLGLIVLVIFLFILPLGSVVRFKEGRQD